MGCQQQTLEKISDLRIKDVGRYFFLYECSFFQLPNLWGSLGPYYLGALWAVEQANAQSFVVQPAQAKLELNVYDAYAVEDLRMILRCKMIQR